MTEDIHLASHGSQGEFNLDILESRLNVGYLAQPIPAPRDREIFDLLSRAIADRRIARFRGSIRKSHVDVLNAFSERMVSRAVRKNDLDALALGLIPVLLAWHETDYRESLPILALYCDAVRMLGLNSASLVDSVRAILGDVLIEPLVKFLARSEVNRSLEAMGYSRSSDNDGFRYIRDR
jgi:hypothetical protein